MATDVTELRTILRNGLKYEDDRFSILRQISSLIQTNEEVGQELLLRVLACKNEFTGYEKVIDGLVMQVGLFPYLNYEKLSFRDALTYELFRPDGINDIVFHKVQAEVYYNLVKGENVILSAPTSFGKSLIVDSILALNKFKNIVVIVPSIALIDETRRRLSKFNRAYKIITHAQQSLDERNVFVLTQERAVEIVKSIKIDFFVIDEFYKLYGDNPTDERTQILNKVFYQLVKSNAQFYLLGPNIDGINVGKFDQIKYKFIKTDYRTVVSEHHLLKAKDDDEKNQKVLDILTESKGQTLIYCQSPNSANKVATFLDLHFAKEKNSHNSDLVQWIKDNYHEDWLFATAIEHGIGIHHGKIPRSLSQLCVRLFNVGKLHCLVCTSTLIEGVNTKAQNVIVYDNKIARRKLDFFTFNNICGRSGRMFSHFIGHIYIFKDAPISQLPLVEFPVFTQSVKTPDSMLINIDEDDLTDESKKRIKHYKEQHVLKVETLQDNSYVGLDKLLQLASCIEDNLSAMHCALCWDRYPNKDQISQACTLIWTYINPSQGNKYGVSSARQLAYRLGTYQKAGCIKKYIETLIDSNTSVNEAIELALDIQRHWINFKFPRYLKCLCQIANDVFERHGLKMCDYTFFANYVENYFGESYITPFDEYGLPIQITKKIAQETTIATDNIDLAFQQLKQFDVDSSKLSRVEKKMVKIVQENL